MLRSVTNPWSVGSVEPGTGIDLQRADLWRLDLSTVIQYFASDSDIALESIGLSRANIPNLATEQFFAVSISLPQRVVQARKFVQNTVARNMPSYMAPIDAIRIDFYHESANHSAMYVLLKAWMQLARIGRKTTTGEPAFLLPSVTWKPSFQFTINVQFLTGSNDGVDLNAGAKYSLTNCWISGLQQAQLDRSKSANPHLITARLQPTDIICL